MSQFLNNESKAIDIASDDEEEDTQNDGGGGSDHLVVTGGGGEQVKQRKKQPQAKRKTGDSGYSGGRTSGNPGSVGGSGRGRGSRGGGGGGKSRPGINREMIAVAGKDGDDDDDEDQNQFVHEYKIPDSLAKEIKQKRRLGSAKKPGRPRLYFTERERKEKNAESVRRYRNRQKNYINRIEIQNEHLVRENAKINFELQKREREFESMNTLLETLIKNMTKQETDDDEDE